MYAPTKPGEVGDDEQIIKALKKQREVNAVLRNAKWVRRLKELYGSTCQVSAEHVLNTPDGRYAEVHHIHGVADGGPLHMPSFGNEIVVCPNCHSLFGCGAIWVDRTDGMTLRHYKKDPEYEGMKLRFEADHVLARTYLQAALPSRTRAHPQLT